MLFNSVAFLAFFTAFFVAYHFGFKTRDGKLWLIALGSLFFYGTWSVRFLPFLLGTGTLDFYLARRIADSPPASRARRWLLALSITTNISVLAIFKYAGFFAETLSHIAHVFGRGPIASGLSLVVPLGISFYTFQAISYTVDVSGGVVAPCRRVHEFIAALAFFPHLLAGPIVRSSFLLPQFEQMRPPTRAMVRRAFLLIAVGLFKKTIADMLSTQVDPAYGGSAVPGMLLAWIAALAFPAQIYADFSAYTDMATGFSLLLGFDLPENFNLPYLSRSPNEFWQRWHISLSSWLRDYLFTPLARSRLRLIYLNFVITMTLAGLWHGPRWTYVFYGFYWGIIMAVVTFVDRRLPAAADEFFERPLVRVAQVLGTFYVIVVACVFFRAETMARAWTFLAAMHGRGVGSPATATLAIVMGMVVAALVGCHVLDYFVLHSKRLRSDGRILWPVVVTGVAFSLLMPRGQAFIYFGF